MQFLFTTKKNTHNIVKKSCVPFCQLVGKLRMIDWQIRLSISHPKGKKKKAGKEFLWQLVKASRMNVIKKNQQMRFFGYIIGVDVRKVKTIPIIPRLFVRTIWNDCLDWLRATRLLSLREKWITRKSRKHTFRLVKRNDPYRGVQHCVKARLQEQTIWAQYYRYSYITTCLWYSQWNAKH